MKPTHTPSGAERRIGCRMAPALGALFVFIALAASACGGDDSNVDADRDVAAVPTTPELTRPDVNPALVGRWSTQNRCRQLVKALDKAGLERFTGEMLTGQYRDESAKVIARDRRPCQGARSFKHDHSFDENGAFASFDEHGQRVDEGTYQVKGDTLIVSRPPIDVRVRFQIRGRTASFEPLIPEECDTKPCRDAALLNIGTFFPRTYTRVE